MSKGLLLLVDDESEYLENLQDDLEGVVEHFLTAENGVAALNLLKKNQVDCIVTDINMPEKNGIELAREARKLGIEVPIIFLTAHGDDELMKKAQEYLAFDFIDKPYDVNQLIITVSEAVKLGMGLNDKKF